MRAICIIMILAFLIWIGVIVLAYHQGYVNGSTYAYNYLTKNFNVMVKE